MENGRWCKGLACWVALMMSWGAVGEESEKKICGHMTEDEEEEWRSPAESRELSSPFQNEVDHWSDFIRLLFFCHCSELPSALHLQHRVSIKAVYNFPRGYVKALHYFEIDPSRGTVKPFPTSTLKTVKEISRKRRQHVALTACVAAEVWVLNKADNFTSLLFINRL